jgi:hypothetical protein
MASFNNDKRFDIDLAYGNIHEQQVAEMLEGAKIEVKTERNKWAETGNICLEYESYGKPSGIASTEADYWFHRLAIEDEVYCTLVFDVTILRKILKRTKAYKRVSGGDNNASRILLVPLAQLLSPSTVQKYIKEENQYAKT